MTTEQQLNKIGSRLVVTQAVAFVACVAAVIALMSSFYRPETVTARAFRVVGPLGQQFVWMGESTGGQGMVITLDGRGQELVLLGATADDEGVVTTMNRNGQELVELGVTTEGEGMVFTGDGQGLTDWRSP